MRSFAAGALGALAVLIVAGIVMPLYSDYRTMAQSYAWLAQVRPTTMLEIADAAKRLGTVRGSGVGIALPALRAPAPEWVEVTEDGTLMIHGGRDGQLMVWTPQLIGTEVVWLCRGGSARDVPRECRVDAER